MQQMMTFVFILNFKEKQTFAQNVTNRTIIDIFSFFLIVMQQMWWTQQDGKTL